MYTSSSSMLTFNIPLKLVESPSGTQSLNFGELDQHSKKESDRNDRKCCNLWTPNERPQLEPPLQELIGELKFKTRPQQKMSKEKQEASDKFWENIKDDILAYNKQIHTDFRKKCSFPNQDYWDYETAGIRPRAKVYPAKFPIKVLSIFLSFCAGLLKLIRVHQDGKASFYGNIISTINNLTIFLVLLIDGDPLALPKLAGCVMTGLIVWGIIMEGMKGGEIGL